ncbi:uncharacterized protein LOC122510016 isoform X2 [Leptopilina heterotoma]|uniref:uncharacterized protein LOC122510016 isoform X2 n=1 Tax=Leptopilina heterotoma TaxID=63436 RepID=UPI001CA84F2C|nr:uncharacterized protein LOC122510016 isoform X2 [Leptopilina heterotoma]
MERKRYRKEDNRIRNEKFKKIRRSLQELESCSNDISFEEPFDESSDENSSTDEINPPDLNLNNFNANDIIEDEIHQQIHEEEEIIDEQDIEDPEQNEFNEDNFLNDVLGGQEDHSSTDDDSSADEEENNDDPPVLPNVPPEIDQLRHLANEKNIPQSTLDQLLKILRQRLLPSLPKSSKTFLKTSDSRYNIIDMEGMNGEMGEFVYFGLESGLKNCVNVDLHPENIINLQIFIDGMQLTKSGHLELFVTLCKIFFEPDIYKVFPVAVFCGKTKPRNVDDYLDELIDELNDLHENGLIIEDKLFSINIKCIICDTPARAFLKNTMGHKSFVSCERCEIVGHSEERTTVFPSINERERTDNSFRNQSQPEHHHGPSPFCRIIPPLNIIKIFILDSMHLLFLGIMKKLLEYWLVGSLNFRLGLERKKELAKRMKHIYSQIPIEFQRKTRSIIYHGKWKAVEFRFFLLYCGPVVLKHILRKELYQHFLLLHASSRILSSDVLCNRYTNNSKMYLRTFFTTLKDIYGPKSQTLNSHHVIHVADDVETMNCSLSRVNAFAFESYLGKLKKLIRTPHRPLAQLCRRLYERNIAIKEKVEIPPLFQILKRNEDSIEQIKYKETTISTSEPNNIVLSENDTVLQIRTIFETAEGIKFEAQVWEKATSLFNYPFDSDRLKMWQLLNAPCNRLSLFSLESIQCKMVKLSVPKTDNSPEKFYVMPILHSQI